MPSFPSCTITASVAKNFGAAKRLRQHALARKVVCAKPVFISLHVSIRENPPAPGISPFWLTCRLDYLTSPPSAIPRGRGQSAAKFRGSWRRSAAPGVASGTLETAWLGLDPAAHSSHGDFARVGRDNDAKMNSAANSSILKPALQPLRRSMQIGLKVGTLRTAVAGHLATSVRGDSAMAPTKKKKLGEVLRDRGSISSADLSKALEDQQGKVIHLGELMLERGLVSKPDLVAALAEVTRVPYVDCSTAQVDLAVLQRIPRNVAQRCCVFPLVREGPRLVI